MSELRCVQRFKNNNHSPRIMNIFRQKQRISTSSVESRGTYTYIYTMYKRSVSGIDVTLAIS